MKFLDSIFDKIKGWLYHLLVAISCWLLRLAQWLDSRDILALGVAEPRQAARRIRNVNVYLSNWHSTGQAVSVQQYEVTIRVDWIGQDNASHTRTETILFPNALAQVPTSWLKDELTDLLFRALRYRIEND